MDGFFSNLLAGLIILIIGSFTVPWYLDWRKRPRLTIINPRTRNNKFTLTKTPDGLWESILELVIKNETTFSQREWFWHIIVPLELNPQFESLDQTVTCQHNLIQINGYKWRHYFGSSTPKEVIFPKRGLRFNYRIKVKTSKPDKKEHRIYYYFNTEFGSWPPKANQIESEIINQSVDQEIVFNSDYLRSIVLNSES